MTRAEVRFQVARLLEVYPAPKHFPSNPDELARIYGAVLEPLDVGAVAGAVNGILASAARFFPTPGQIASAAGHRRLAGPRTPRSDYLAWEADWGRKLVSGPNGEELTGFTACPVCGAEVEVGPRIRVVHRASVHHDRGMPVIGWSDEAERFYESCPPYQRPAPRLGEAA